MRRSVKGRRNTNVLDELYTDALPDSAVGLLRLDTDLLEDCEALDMDVLEADDMEY